MMMIPSKPLIIFFVLFRSLSPVYAEVVLDGTLGARMTLNGPKFLIEDTLGKQVGSNLFHSFESFTINTGESATFTGPDSVRNVIGRVTGSSASQIDGMLRSQIPNADVYLLNPNGIMFGKNASLDIQGSFHASTANSLHLEDDGHFDASTPSNSRLTIAPPSSFGFLDNNPAEISIKKSLLQVPRRQTLSFIGGDLHIHEGTLYAPDGRINLVSMASMGQVMPGLSNTTEKFGTITLYKSPDTPLQNMNGHEIANIDTSGVNGGEIFIQGGNFFSTGGHIYSEIVNYANEVEDNPTQHSKITILAKKAITLSEQSDISVDSEQGTSHRAGDISIKTQDMMLEKESSMSSRPFGKGYGGNITITTKNLAMKRSSISTKSGRGVTGNAGNIQLEIGQLTLQDGGLLNSGTLGTGNGGDISINATEGISLLTHGFRSRIASSVGDTKTGEVSGDGGNIHIVAPRLEIKDNSAVQTGTFKLTTGNAGNIQLDVNNLVLENGGMIVTATAGSGVGGNIDISSINTAMKKGLILSSSADRGNAGSITITTNTALLTDESFLSSLADVADGGDITLKVHDHLTIKNRSGITSQVRENAPQTGNAGDIQIDANHLRLHDAIINATTFGSGIGGDIDIFSNDIEINDGAKITAESVGNNNAGNAGSISLTTNTVSLNKKSAISTEAIVAGGGNIDMTVHDSLYLVDSKITAEAGGNKSQDNGGNLTIENPTLFIIKNSQLRANAYVGNGGKIDIKTNKFDMLGDSTIDVSSELGLNGQLIINSVELKDINLLSHDYLNADKLKVQCEARVIQDVSKLFTVGRDGIPIAPDDLKTHFIFPTHFGSKTVNSNRDLDDINN